MLAAVATLRVSVWEVTVSILDQLPTIFFKRLRDFLLHLPDNCGVVNEMCPRPVLPIPYYSVMMNHPTVRRAIF
jgi:hypothetical protein